jgi:hypothetical protein
MGAAAYIIPETGLWGAIQPHRHARLRSAYAYPVFLDEKRRLALVEASEHVRAA